MAFTYNKKVTEVEKSIHEESEKINKVKRIIKQRSSEIDNYQIIPEALSTEDWKQKEFSCPDTIVRLGTVFSGIGAIEHAFQRLKLKHKIVFAGDIDANCKKSYFANYNIKEEDWFTDIREFNASEYKGKVDFIVGGAPCQAFSMVGKRLGFEDARGTLFYEFARIVKETEPKVFLFENVKGLLNHDGGRTWHVIHDIFEELGYDVHFRVLNSKDYGIPQNRERLYCLGFKKKTEFQFPAPIELEYRMYDFLEDYVDTKYFLRERGIKFITSRKNREKSYFQANFEEEFDEFIFDVRDVKEKYYLSEKMVKYVLAGGTKNFKTSTDTDLDVARPLLQTMHKMHRAGVDNYVTHKGRMRKLTPRECLRLMGFKDSFKIVVSDTSMYQESGNSIVVDVLIAILKQLDITEYAVKPLTLGRESVKRYGATF